MKEEIATDPIAIAALIVALQDANNEYTSAITPVIDANRKIEDARKKVSACQQAIDRAFQALRKTGVTETPWHEASQQKNMQDLLSNIRMQMEKEKSQAQSQAQALSQQALSKNSAAGNAMQSGSGIALAMNPTPPWVIPSGYMP